MNPVCQETTFFPVQANTNTIHTLSMAHEGTSSQRRFTGRPDSGTNLFRTH